MAEELILADDPCMHSCFREDCYDYLIEKGFDEEMAYNLMEIIRKGKYRFEENQIESSKLPEDFYKWAKVVKFLPLRKSIFDIYQR